MIIFYSWQTDTPNKVGKAFIRSVLDEAAEAVAEDLQLEEAERLEIDQDTQGVLGSPPIAETIFDKIRGADIVVLDVTLTGLTELGKHTINSNVAYEMGYAHGHHGDSVLLKVMNTAYGPPQDLPFDLQHRRWPLQFELAADANSDSRYEARKKLVSELIPILKRYLERASKSQSEDENSPRPEPTSSTYNPASFWSIDERLVRRSGAHGYGTRGHDLGLPEDATLIYLRTWPDEPLPLFSGRELSDYDLTSIEPLIGRGVSYSRGRNSHGTITYADDGESDLLTFTQVLKNREIWGVDSALLRPREFTDTPSKFLPTQAFEDGLRRSLQLYLIAAERFGYGKLVNIQCGIVNADGFFLAMPNKYIERFWGPIFENNVSLSLKIDRADDAAVTDALLAIYEEIFDAAGMQRPENLYDFPSNRQR